MNMEITTDLKNEILNNYRIIENIEVVYKKKEKFRGQLSVAQKEPLEIKIIDTDKHEAEHLVYFGRAVEITLNYFDGRVKVFRDYIE